MERSVLYSVEFLNVELRMAWVWLKVRDGDQGSHDGSVRATWWHYPPLNFVVLFLESVVTQQCQLSRHPLQF